MKLINSMHTYIEYNGIVSGAYLPTQSKMSDTAIVIAQGALSTGDSGKREFHKSTIPYGIPVFIPDYYGHSRSDGRFTPRNCAKTIVDTIDTLKGGALVYNAEENKRIRYKFKNVIVVGTSFGGWIPWYINTFFPKHHLERFGLMAPLVDLKNQATKKFPKEESAKSFLQRGNTIYKNIYRGISSPVWNDFLFAKKAKNDPMKNLEKIAGSKIVIAHGKEDTSINPKKSTALYNKLLALNPADKHLKIFSNAGHGADELTIKGAMTYLLKNLLTKEELSKK